MARGMQWDRARDHDRLKRPMNADGRPPKEKNGLRGAADRIGTTDKQARFITTLRDRAGESAGPIPGLRRAASIEIERLLTMTGNDKGRVSSPRPLSNKSPTRPSERKEVSEA